MKKENGITLVALVISIIVLLILEGVTIVTITGDNGLLQKSKSLKQEIEEAKELELIKLAVSAAQLTGQGTITTDNLNNELKSNLKNNVEANEISVGWFYQAVNNYRIYKDGNVLKANKVPEEYQQLEYIESTGSQYIDLMLNASQYPNIYVEIDGNYINVDNYPYIFGAGFHNDYNTNCSWKLIGIIQGYKFVAQNGISGKEKEIMAADTQKHTFILDTVSSIGKIDQNSQVLDNNGVKPINYNYLLFALNDHGVIKRNASFKMYYCKIKNDDALIRNFIPCKSTTTTTNANGIEVPENTKGLYDLVEGKFYTNSNTIEGAVDFTSGPEV